MSRDFLSRWQGKDGNKKLRSPKNLFEGEFVMRGFSAMNKSV